MIGIGLSVHAGEDPHPNGVLKTSQRLTVEGWMAALAGNLTADMEKIRQHAKKALEQSKNNRTAFDSDNKAEPVVETTPLRDADLGTKENIRKAGLRAVALWTGGNLNKKTCRYENNRVDFDFAFLEAKTPDPGLRRFQGQLIILEEFLHDRQEHAILAYLRKQGLDDDLAKKAPPEQDIDGDGDKDSVDTLKLTAVLKMVSQAKTACKAFGEAEARAR